MTGPLDLIATILNTILWMIALGVSFLRLTKNNLTPLEKFFYGFSAFSSSTYVVINASSVFFTLDPLERVFRLQIAEAFVGGAFILFLIFYRNKRRLDI